MNWMPRYCLGVNSHNGFAYTYRIETQNTGSCVDYSAENSLLPERETVAGYVVAIPDQ